MTCENRSFQVLEVLHDLAQLKAIKFFQLLKKVDYKRNLEVRKYIKVIQQSVVCTEIKY